VLGDVGLAQVDPVVVEVLVAAFEKNTNKLQKIAKKIVNKLKKY
jgi:hypothetical protein